MSTELMTSHPGGRVYGVLQVWLAYGGQDEYPILKPEVNLGRAGDNDIILDNPKVSGHHLRLSISADSRVTAMDLGALNGTLLNGQPMPARTSRPVRPGDVLQIDEFCFSVRLPSPESPAPPALAERVRLSSAPGPALAVFAHGRLTKHAIAKPTTEIGHAPGNDIVIVSPHVAEHHARIQQSGDAFIIQDLSGSGLIYDDQRVQQQALQDGDVVYISSDVILQMRACLGFVPAVEAVASVKDVTVPDMRALDKQDITIGRASDNTIVIEHPQVSRYHAVIERLGARRRIRDLKSSNGVFVNGKRIEREAWLQEGDEVYVGPVKLRLAAEGVHRVADEGVRLDALRLNKWVSKSKNLLQDISLSIQPQEFVVIVGLSGAGKSMLLDALNGFRPATHGAVLVNGVDLYQNFDLFRNDVGYVPQKDIVHADLTVHKALDYAAQLRMPADTSQAERHQRIMEVLADLDLTERKDLPIHKLSGGQLKRVSIGVELLTKPRLFFLDEPTSGLDPGTEYNMMRLLRKLADQGRTILLVTHATKNVMMCDKVIILARGGHVAFYGLPEEALTYFDQYRTEHERRIKDMEFDDIYTILEDEQRGAPEEWDKRYRQSSAFRKYVVGPLSTLRQEQAKLAGRLVQQRPRVNMVRQFFILTRRYMDLVVRDRLLLFVLLGVMPFIGVMLLMISQPNWLAGNTEAEIERQLTSDLAAGWKIANYSVIDGSRRLLFMLALAVVLLGLFAAGFEIIKEWAIYQRERMVTVRILPYLASKVVVLGTFAMIQCLLLLVVVSFKVRLPTAGVFFPAPFEMYVTLVLGTLAAIWLGLLISASVPNPNPVIYILFVVLFLQFIFAGVIYDLPGLANSLSTLTLSRWTMEGLGTSSNVEELNRLTRARVQVEPITQTVSTEIERPAPDWQPITVVTVTRELKVPGLLGAVQTIPISVPQVTVNRLVTITETVSRTFTINPPPLDIPGERDLYISYTHTPWHLFKDWLTLIGYGLIFGAGTAIVLKRKDIS